MLPVRSEPGFAANGLLLPAPGALMSRYFDFGGSASACCGDWGRGVLDAVVLGTSSVTPHSAHLTCLPRT